jgi:phosphoglycolate phosphatase
MTPAIKQKVFIDLDGTIFDGSEKAWRVYKDILKKNKIKGVSKDTYLSLRGEGFSIKKIIQKTGKEDFKEELDKMIESAHYLSLDKLSPARRKVLFWLNKNFEVILVTLRKNQRRTLKQLKDKDIDRLFDKILIVGKERCLEPKWTLKYKAIKNYGGDKNSIIIGDSETDILAGKKIGMKTIGVLWGVRNKKNLEKYKPDILVKTIKELKNAILN